MPLMFTSERASNGSRQKPWPMMSGGVGTSSSSSTGKPALTKMMLPGSLMLLVEPNPMVPPSSLASRYTQERIARLKGISSRSLAKKYWRKYSPWRSNR